MSLRLLEIVIATDAADEARQIIADRTDQPVWIDAFADDLTLLRVLLPSEQTEPITDGLETLLMDREELRIMILPVEAAIPRIDLPAEPSAPPAAPPRTPARISRAELYANITSATRSIPVFVVMTILASIVAGIGILRDNSAILIAAMVIAPLLGPNMALALAATLADGPLAWRSIGVNLLGSGAALLVAIVIGLVFVVDPTSAELAARTSLSMGDLLLALSAGVAGTLAVTTGAPATLVGVMVAVALVPPLVVLGMLGASGQWDLAVGAALLLAANVICVNIAATMTFMVLGVRPAAYWEAKAARRSSIIAIAIWIILLAALVVIVLVSEGAGGDAMPQP